MLLEMCEVTMSVPVFRFDPPPPFTKKIIIGLLLLYVVELIVEQWMSVPLLALMAWQPGQTLNSIWQPFTQFFYQGSGPFSALLELLALYFFLPPAQRSFGRKGIYKLALYVVATVVFFGSLMLILGAVTGSTPAMGISPFITALVVVFGLSNPNATIFLLIFPIQAAWVAWGTGLFAGLGFLSTRSLPSALWVAGWIAGYVFMETRPGGRIRRFFIKRKHAQTNKRLSRFTVIDGGKDDTFH